jgi:hypothetical protein
MREAQDRETLDREPLVLRTVAGLRSRSGGRGCGAGWLRGAGFLGSPAEAVRADEVELVGFGDRGLEAILRPGSSEVDEGVGWRGSNAPL